MISRLFKSKKRIVAPTAPSVPRVPDGEVAWAIGDIHGRLDLLEPLVEAIRADAAVSGARRTTVIFLGDYIDRGPESRGVIRYLAALPQDEGIQWRFLKGNHEEAMLNFLVDPAEGAKWCEYGGDATLKSYGLRVPQMKHVSGSWAHLSADLGHKVTVQERAFLDGLELSVSVGDYFFAHAGARPGQSLHNQSSADLMWIRRSFLESDIEFEQVIVHGHTPTPAVHSDRRRLGIDTKAYETGVLTALRLAGSHREILQTFADDSAAANAPRFSGVTVRRSSLDPVAASGQA